MTSEFAPSRQNQGATDTGAGAWHLARGRAVHGFTLIELLAVLTIAAILAVIAVPSFMQSLANARSTGAANDLLAGFYNARSHAIRLGRNVVVCRSVTAAAASPTCSAAAAGAFAANDWAAGWVIFVDDDADGTIDAAEVIVAAQQAVSDTASRVVLRSGAAAVTFTAEGLRAAAEGASTINVEYTAIGSGAVSARRCVRIAATGVPAVSPGACS